VVTDVDGGDGISQVLSNLKGSTTYRVTAQVLETGADECTLATTGAATQVTGMVSVDNTAFAQLDGFFITSAALDEVTITLTNTAAGDICTWDHIGVYRQEAVEVPEAGIVAVYDTYVTSDGADVASTYGDVPDLSITFVPPTEGWVIDVRSNISIGCTSCGLAAGEGAICQIEKGGTAIAGTERTFIAQSTSTAAAAQIAMDTVDINPAAGTSIIYTVACQKVGTNALLYNKEDTENNDIGSSLTMIAYPPH
jgi:hypothetical protein